MFDADLTSWDLPEDLFDTKSGETRPSKPVKKTVKQDQTDTKVTRNISEVEVCAETGACGDDDVDFCRARRRTAILPSDNA